VTVEDRPKPAAPASDFDGDGHVAVIGMAGRFPGARDLAAYWDNLLHGRESITPFSGADFVAAGGDPGEADDPYLVKVESVLDGIDEFDAEYHGYPPAEARLLDPQQRLLLQCAQHALDDAGQDPSRYLGAVGVYAGAQQSRYLLTHLYPRLVAAGDELALEHAQMVNGAGSLATRVSYELGLTGPAMSVQTACSSSLVAVHLAAQELLGYRCDMALAGGVSLTPLRRRGYRYVQGGPLSPDGHCRAFDARAAGMVPAEGVGLVVLKRLEDALADRDHIRAVIKGSAVNNDGRRKVGFAAPSVDGQAEVIVSALAVAGVTADSIGYVEAHGTGTPVGDPIEFAALAKAFARSTDRKGFCGLGSAKSNIGHADAAAGVAGLIKAVLVLENRVLPPAPHFTEPNPLIDLADSPFFVTTRARPWAVGDTPRRACVSALGIGGTNAHMVLQEAPAHPNARSVPDRDGELIVLSAKSADALREMTAALSRHLIERPHLVLADVAHTLRTGRASHPHRRAVPCRDLAQAARVLGESGGYVSPGAVTERPVAFMFPGAGAQYARMGRGLYEREPVFRDVIDRASRVLRAAEGTDLREVLYAPPRVDAADDAAPLDGAVFPAMVATEYALASLLRSWGITPRASIGHSLGEYTAACVSGVLDLADVLPLVAERERLFRRAAAGGSLLGVHLGEDELREFWTEGDVSLAAINSDHSCTLSGPAEAIAEVERRLVRAGATHRRIRFGAAAHSMLLDPILDEYAGALAQVSLRAPEIPYVSNVTGTWITGEQASSPDYWVRHTRETVRFAQGLAELTADPDLVLIEVGPGNGLSRLAGAADTGGRTSLAVPTLRSAHGNEPDARVLDDAIGRLWANGVPVDLASRHRGRPPVRVPLPGYPFARARHWVDPPARTAGREPVAEAPVLVPAWRSLPPVPTSAAGSAARRVLAITASGGAGAELAAGLGAEVLPRPADGCLHSVLRTALATAGATARPITDVLHLDLADAPTDDSVAFELPALAREAAEASVRLWVCSREALDVTGEERTYDAVQAAVAVAGAVGATWLDLDAHPDPAVTAARVAAELAAPVRPGAILAHRGRRRWTAREEPAEPVEPPIAPSVLPARLDDVTAKLPEFARRLRGDRAHPSRDETRDTVLDLLGAWYIHDFLAAHGLDVSPGATHARADVRRAVRVVPAYRPMLDAMLAALAEDGITEVDTDPGVIRFAAAAGLVGDPRERADRMRIERPELAAEIDLLAYCAGQWADVLAGRRTGVEALLPDGRDASLGAVSDRWLDADDVRLRLRLVAATVAELVDQAHGRPVRVLEVGAGRGHLSREVAKALADRPDVEYHVTDLGRSFVLAARERAREEGEEGTRFGVLDVTADPGPQGYPPGTFDLVLAFNVLHATPNLRDTAARCRALLAPGGALLILETTRRRRWSFLTTGLYEGWWHFDDDLRETSPLLDAQAWTRLLRSAGYREVSAHPGPDSSATATPDHVLFIGRRPDLIGETRVIRLPVPSDSAGAAGVDELDRALEKLTVEDGRILLPMAVANPVDAVWPARAAAWAARRHASGDTRWTVVRHQGELADDRLRTLCADLVVPFAVLPAGTASVDLDDAPNEGAASGAPERVDAGDAFDRRPELSTRFVEPRTPNERTVAGIWRSVLGLDRVGRDDNFFDLGGESLLAMQVVSRLRDAFGVDLSLRRVFDSPTVAELVAYLATAADAPGPPRITPSARRTAQRIRK
jgi:acyl transferase domain-containing protein/SAM-dependent methyltransferase/acyl carrier protein